MSFDYKDDGLLPDVPEEEIITEEEKKTAEEKKEEEYYELPDSPDARRRGWSVISLFSGILAVLLCSVYYVGILFAVVSIASALVSRRRLGYFDGLSLAGLLVGIVGCVFGGFALVVDVTGVLDALKK